MGGSSLFETNDFTFYRDENGPELMFYSGKGGDIRLSVLSERYDIYDSAFFDDYGLFSVRVPGCVREIGKGAFCQCDLFVGTGPFTHYISEKVTYYA
ncbi:MAG: hypothetical protein LUD72_04190 [Bacteroidales bacterium]|nr:hypothetical protein [Bacteroidales bacterium]